jgi:hypothetical protein
MDKTQGDADEDIKKDCRYTQRVCGLWKLPEGLPT